MENLMVMGIEIVIILSSPVASQWYDNRSLKRRAVNLNRSDWQVRVNNKDRFLLLKSWIKFIHAFWIDIKQLVHKYME